jgi:hypothetical protein
MGYSGWGWDILYELTTWPPRLNKILFLKNKRNVGRIICKQVFLLSLHHPNNRPPIVKLFHLEKRKLANINGSGSFLQLLWRHQIVVWFFVFLFIYYFLFIWAISRRVRPLGRTWSNVPCTDFCRPGFFLSRENSAIKHDMRIGRIHPSTTHSKCITGNVYMHRSTVDCD